MPGEFPLLDGFAQDELEAIQSANLPHRCAVDTIDASDVWTEAADDLPCRMMHVSAAVKVAAGQTLRPSTEWLLALEASSPHAGPRRRYRVDGNRPDGTPFTTRTLYSVGARIPHVEESVAVVECTETPAAAGL